MFDALVETDNLERLARFTLADGGMEDCVVSSKGRLPLGFLAVWVLEGTFKGHFASPFCISFSSEFYLPGPHLHRNWL